jgi:hypothetical protein
MARTRESIQLTMDAEQAIQTSLSTLNSPSQTAIYTLWKFITSSIINYAEQLWDIYKAELETKIKVAVVGSNAWYQDQMLKFQYDAVTPQVLVISSDFSIDYSTVDTTKQIITRCSVKTSPTKQVFIKVAKNEPPEALTAPELSAATSYVQAKSFAGVNYTVTSVASDKLFLEAEIFFDGQYSAVISDTVIEAINTYLASIDFDGAVKVSALTDAIQTVTGVKDIVITNLAMRSDGTAFGSKTYLVQAKTLIIPTSTTTAGYIVEETTASNTFVDKLTFTGI